MDRECAIFDLENFVEEVRRQRGTIKDALCLYIDTKCQKELDTLLKDKVWNKTFHRTLSSMMTNRRGRPELYCPLAGYSKYGLWKMRVRTKTNNARLICKEFKNGAVVVLVHLESNKGTYASVTRATKGAFESVKSYTYKTIE